jgi:flagellar motor protein MotB
MSAAGGWDPVRDERGVVVTLHDAFHGQDLNAEAGKRLRDLGRVAAAHPGFALQVVVHDAEPPRAKDPTDAHRASAVVDALVAGGATAARVRSELAGDRAPLVDPRDARHRARNERLDIVFVAASTGH